jgi:hypothetical protein
MKKVTISFVPPLITCDFMVIKKELLKMSDLTPARAEVLLKYAFQLEHNANPTFLSGKTTEVVDERKRRLTAIKADLTNDPLLSTMELGKLTTAINRILEDLPKAFFMTPKTEWKEINIWEVLKIKSALRSKASKDSHQLERLTFNDTFIEQVIEMVEAQIRERHLLNQEKIKVEAETNFESTADLICER